MRITLALTSLLFTACVSAESATIPNTQLDSAAELDSGLADRSAPPSDGQASDAPDSANVPNPPKNGILFIGLASYRGKGSAVDGEVTLPSNCQKGDWLLALFNYISFDRVMLPKQWTEQINAQFKSPEGYATVLLVAEHDVTGTDDLKFVAPNANDRLPNRLDLLCYRNVVRAEQPKSSVVTPKAGTGLVETLPFSTQTAGVVPLYGFSTGFQTNSQLDPPDTFERVAHADGLYGSAIFLYEQKKPVALGTSLPPLAFFIPSAQGQVERAAVFSLVLVPKTP
jgi:hypothetical protein